MAPVRKCVAVARFQEEYPVESNPSVELALEVGPLPRKCLMLRIDLFMGSVVVSQESEDAPGERDKGR